VDDEDVASAVGDSGGPAEGASVTEGLLGPAGASTAAGADGDAVGEGMSAPVDGEADPLAGRSPTSDATEEPASELRDAEVDDDEPSTVDDVCVPLPAMTGTASTRAVTAVATRPVRTRRPVRRRRRVRRSRPQRVSAPARRADKGGPAGRWCTGHPSRRRITIRYLGD
jgi:hypothetical protein